MSGIKTPLTIALFLATFGLLFSCSDNDSSIDQHVDEGELCLSQNDPAILRVGIATDTCYSSSCSEFLETTCTVEREGMTLRVTSVMRVREWGGSCTNDCVTQIPTCKLEGVEAGEYRLIHGEYETTITLPLPDGGFRENPDSGLVCAT